MAQRILIGALLATLLMGGAPAQQPNTPGVASMTFAGFDGPPWPINVQWPSTVMGLAFEGTPGSPYLMVSADNGGILSPGITVPGVGIPDGIVDIDITGGITAILNGFLPANFFDLLATIGPTGFSNWTLPIASSFQGTFQTIVADATSPAGFTLTAASTVTANAAVSQGYSDPVGTGDDIVFQIVLTFGTTTFYDVSYTDLFASANGDVTFGGPDGYWAPTAADFDTGYPRIAPLWTDLLAGILTSGGPFVFTFQETLDGWTLRWVGRDNYSDPAAGTSLPVGTTNNTFSVSYNYTSVVTPVNPLGLPGSIVFDYSLPENIFIPSFPGGVNADWGISGITPGGTVPAASPVPPGTSVALDPNMPLSFNPSIDPFGPPAGGGGISNGLPMTSFRGVFDTMTTPFPAALLSGTGQQVIFFPGNFSPSAGIANTYQLL